MVSSEQIITAKDKLGRLRWDNEWELNEIIIKIIKIKTDAWYPKQTSNIK